jgi:hypothetical protein
MRLPFYIGLIGSLIIAWGAGGLIHTGQRAVNRAAQPAIWQELGR